MFFKLYKPKNHLYVYTLRLKIFGIFENLFDLYRFVNANQTHKLLYLKKKTLFFALIYFQKCFQKIPKTNSIKNKISYANRFVATIGTTIIIYEMSLFGCNNKSMHVFKAVSIRTLKI